jgi:amino acid adenylation domain-containing protein
VHRRIEAQAGARPDALAIAGAGLSLTYGEMNAWANRLAHRLIRLGAGPETVVALLAGRSGPAVVAALAVLKTGGAYLPLDPDHPRARLVSALTEARVLALVGEEELLAARPEVLRAAPTALAVESCRQPGGGEEAADPPDRASPDNLAYVVYTSGSTGRPKGVEVPRRSLANLVDWHLATYRVTAADRASRLAAPAFDASVWETWPYLVAGASLHVPGRDTLLSPRRLITWLARRRITLAFLPTPLAEAALVEQWPRDLALRVLFTGGDRLHRWARADLPFELHNLYGPAESCVVSTWARVPRPPREGRSEVAMPPIGQPLPGVRVHLHDGQSQPVAGGEAGELVIGGAGLARGYRHRPGLTAGAFVPDPDPAAESGARLYRTGDLARRLADGQLLCLGRLDLQVKLRGVRIEPGEVEAALRRHPGVAAAAVLVRRHGEEPVLVAAVVPAAAGGGAAPRRPLTAGRMRAFLGRRLPAAMVPTDFLFLAALPLTVNGKVDREAIARLLPERRKADAVEPPAAAGEAAAADPPRTPLEHQLAAIFAEVLERPGVGIHDDFFALGGHSLLATRVLSRVRAASAVEIPQRALFDAPTVAALAALVAAAQQRAGRALPPELATILPRPPGGAGDLPLSAAQERLWFLDRLLPGIPLYNLPFTLHLRGELTPRALAAALGEIGRRHEVLRTTFHEVEGRPVQRVRPPAPVRPPAVDLGGLAAGDRRRQADRLAGRGGRIPFDLARSPSLRLALLRLAPAEHLLLVCLHHVAFDGWSARLLLDELAAHYRSLAAGAPPRLPEPTLQYADFALWQRRLLGGGVLADQLAYWRRQLAGAPEALELATDRPRPAAQSFRGARFVELLPAAVGDQLAAYSRQTDGSPFITLLTAFAVLLGRLSGAEDLLLGAPVANRHRLELEGLIGFFVNTLVLRADLGGRPSFLAATARTRETALAAYSHQDLPFDRLVEELKPGRGLSANPLVQVFFALQEVPNRRRELAPGLSCDFAERSPGTTLGDLTLIAEPTPAGLSLLFEFATDLWDGTTIRRFAGHFRRLLEAGLSRPELLLWELPLLAPAERHQLLADWNDTACPPPEEPFVHRRVAARAATAPDAVAVADGDGQLSYGELWRRARRLAGRLGALGAGPDRVVGLRLERSPEQVVAALATLTAGGAYLPIDPLYPTARAAAMLGDSDALALIVAAGADGGLAPWPGPVLPLAAAGAAAATGPAAGAAPAERSLAPGHLAYAIFTSGSTGRPKGVAIPHAALAALVAWHLRAYAVRAGERAVLLAGPAFDAAVWELWPYLCAGARLEVAGEEVRTAPGRLAGWLRERAVSLCFLPTPLAEALAGEEAAPGVHLRALLTGGDRLHRPAAGACRWPLVNHYGPTECTVVATWAAVSAAATDREPAIGRPREDLRAYVLDPAGQPLPPGLAGELCLAGGGLARGYLGRPALTARAFVPDPFAAGAGGGRLYRTGDLVRHRRRGELEFLGRIDQQVKIRGFRIEPGEVEAHLAACPGVAQAAVVPQGEGADARLVAWLTREPGGGPPPESAELARFLAARVPAFMVPSRFGVLESLPLTPNGKVDRRALGSLEPPAAAAEPTRQAPLGPVEEVLAGIWRQLLGVAGVAPGDDFFRLGGHSLVAVQVQSRIRRALGVEVPVRTLFEEPTLGGLGRWVERARRGSAAAPTPPLAPRRRGAAVPASFAQARLWVLDRLQPGQPTYNIPVAWRLDGPLELPPLARALGEVTRRHESLRTFFEARDGEPFQVVMPAAAGLDLVDLGGLPPAAAAAAAESLAGREARRPFDLARGPLLRRTLLRLGGERHRLLLTVHHVAADGWSIPLLEGELATLYGAFAAGRPSPLPELGVQYADFTLWQRSWLTGDTLAGQLAFWRHRLAGPPPALELPGDRPRAPVETTRGAVARRRLGALVPALRALAQERGATLFMVLLAAYQALLARTCGQQDFAVGTPVANRRTGEVEDLIGFFVNTLAMRADLGGGPSFAALLERVRDDALDAYAHQDLPFERLVEELAVARDLSRSPLFQVMLALEADSGAAGELAPGLAWERSLVHPGIAKFDLSLYLQLRGDELVAAAEYRTELFDRTTVERLLGHFETLLAAAAREPQRSVRELPLLSRGERWQLAEWGDGGPSAALGADGAAATLHGLVAAQAARTPQAIALVAAADHLSYAGLEGRSQRLAGVLRGLGAGPERAVALFLRRTPELVVAMLAALRSGAAYLPLDPGYPADRLAFMLADSDAVVALTVAELAPALRPHGRPLLCLDGEDRLAPPAAPPLPPGDPDGLAYLIYTSGSTGRPKGVAIAHRSAVALLAWAAGVFAAGEVSAMLAATSVCFDLSVFEIFLPLARGGKVVLADDALALARLPGGGAVSLVNTVPSALAELLRRGALPASVVTVNLAGEPLPAALAAAVHQQPGVARLYNLYGPSEATTYSTWGRVERRSGRPPDIGRPVAGTRAHVVDRRLLPQPCGVPGELCLTGDGLARGYLARPAQTAAGFVPDPFSATPGARLYRTLDRARFLADGRLEFLGRFDRQVKLRGFRIELGEVEVALRAVPGVADAAVDTRPLASGEAGLVAWVVPAADSAPTAAGLRRRLLAVLPSYMAPAAFVFLPALPLSPNGKVDRRALPPPGGERSAEGDYAPPRTPVEELVAGIWSQVLGVKRVGIRDSFFALGGHSLAASKVASRLQDLLDVEVPLRILFEAPTVEALVATLGQLILADDEPAAAWPPPGPEPELVAPGPAVPGRREARP